MAEHNHPGPGVLRGDDGLVLAPHPGCLACAENLAAVHDAMPCLVCFGTNRAEHEQWAVGQPHDYAPAAGFCEDCETWVDADHYRAAGYPVS